MKALLLAKCFSSLGGTVPLKTNGLGDDGWKITAAQPFVIDGDGVNVSVCCSNSLHLNCLSPSR